jgi:hypothetical protein
MRWWRGSFVQDQHAKLDCYSASSLKQHSADSHVAPLGHITQILSQPVFALSPSCCIMPSSAKKQQVPIV